MKKLFTKVTAIAMAALMMSPLMAVNVSAREDVPDLINEDEVVAENEAAGGEMPGYNKLRNIIHSQGQRTEITTIYHELDGEFVEHPEYGYTVEKKLDNGATLSLVLTTCGHPDYDNLNVIYTMGSKRVELLTSECSFVYCCYKNFDYNAVYTNGNKKAFVGDVEKYNTFNGNLINWNVKVFNIEKPDDYYGTEITDENFNKETRQMVTEAFTQYIRYCKSAYGLNPADLDFPMYGISYGWSAVGDSYRYYYSNGSYARGWKQIGGLWYYFKDNGYMAKGWTSVQGFWYYFSPDNGNMWTGWHQIGGKWYCFHKTDGYMRTGWVKEGGLWYYLRPSGEMATGWTYADRKGWYYLSPDNGNMWTGWHKINGMWYYLDKTTGKMASSTWVGDYYLSYDGHMLTKQWVDDGKYYVGVDGRKVTNAWVDQYNYVGADGKRVSGMVKN